MSAATASLTKSRGGGNRTATKTLAVAEIQIYAEGPRTPAVASPTTIATLSKETLPDPGELPLHIRNVAVLRGLGFSFSKIARHYGVTPQAISVLLKRQRVSLQKERNHSELAGLSPRAANCLGRLNILTRLAAQKHSGLERVLDEQRNCGQKTIEEILRWAGGATGSARSAGQSSKSHTKKLH